ncbi:acyl-CoA dehydrogenase family protein [Streptomyces sp. NPDC058045]|uniref:acyl-CoA dehydrogenase family protein n=1 Tax=Streptomyces sp. NPDC058045 TaxID=3346311 RepID=UPI0036E579CC
MDFQLTAEQQAFVKSVRSFAAEKLNVDNVERDQDAVFLRELWTECARFGVQGLPIPEEYGGQGADVLTTVLAMEALGEGCRDGGLLFSLNAHLWSAALPLVEFGTTEQKERYLPGMCDGSLIAVHAITEPGSGSDAMALATTARLDGDAYVLDGGKQFITNAPVADVFIVFATVDPGLGWAGITAFFVPRDTPGLTVGSSDAKMGLRTSPTGELSFQDCRIPKHSVLGVPGAGMMIFEYAMRLERACIMASSVGTMQRQLDESVAHANSRQQFGQPIGDFQAVSHMLADMQVRLTASRLLAYRGGWLADQGALEPLEASAIKLYLSEAYLQSSLDTVQVHGGYGIMAEAGIERYVRDAVVGRIYSGTNQMQRNIIAQHLRATT